MPRSIIILIGVGFPFLLGQNVSSNFSQIEIESGNQLISDSSEFLVELSKRQSLSGSDLEKLALIVVGFGPEHYSEDRWRAGEMHQIYWKARHQLLSNESHAKHFANKIIAIHRSLERDETNWPLARSRVHHPIECLKSMPSHESVVELVSLLDMQSNWYGNRFFGREQILFKGQKPNGSSASIAGMAASALYEIGIEDGASKVCTLNSGQTLQLNHGVQGDFFVHEWKKWWQEVVDGKRTFGFEGDPRRYNHLGVVKIRETPKKN
ncbi:MAG: hypothetical protein Q7Q71_08770, partial [Verrucomicrobiota bacterium JB023]|nr:hypothetical protein [Verrucomicrobiota bacterium JB023]